MLAILVLAGRVVVAFSHIFYEKMAGFGLWICYTGLLFYFGGGGGNSVTTVSLSNV